MSRGVWKAVETKAGKVEMAKAEERGAEGRRKEARRKGEEKGREKTKEIKKAESTKDSRRIGDLERRRRGSKIRGRSKRLVLKRFYKWIQVFGKKASERMSTRKLWDYAIDMKEGFVPRKEKVYLLSRKERKEVHEFITEQLRKEYIRPSKSPQMASVFFVGKKDRKKRMV